MDFLRLTFKNPATGATTATITLTSDEIPAGITRNVPYQVRAYVTTEGLGRSFPKQDGTYFSFTVVLANNITMKKLEDISTRVALGDTVDALALSGSMAYNATTEQLQYNTALGTLNNAVFESIGVDFRQFVGTGQRNRVEVPIVIRQGGALALPFAADYVGN